MNIKLNFIIAIFITCGVLGCTSAKIHSIPIEKSHFEMDKIELKKTFSDIVRYEHKFLPVTTPYVHDLIEQWDEPIVKKNDWAGKGLIYSILIGSAYITPTGAIVAAAIVTPIWPVPNEYYYWNKGNYCIEVYTEKNMMNSYQPTLLYWNWYEINSNENIPEECNTSLSDAPEGT